MSAPFKAESDWMDDLSIKSTRIKFGLSQAQLAGLLGVSRHTVIRWEETPGYVPKIVQLAIEQVKENLQASKEQAEFDKAKKL